ncbi:hypothetical protein D3C72_2407890 [compost metagenome]
MAGDLDALDGSEVLVDGAPDVQGALLEQADLHGEVAFGLGREVLELLDLLLELQNGGFEVEREAAGFSGLHVSLR